MKSLETSIYSDIYAREIRYLQSYTVLKCEMWGSDHWLGQQRRQDNGGFCYIIRHSDGTRAMKFLHPKPPIQYRESLTRLMLASRTKLVRHMIRDIHMADCEREEL